MSVADSVATVAALVALGVGTSVALKPTPAGVAVSILMPSPLDAKETFPAPSVAVALTVCEPSATALPAVKLQLPLPSAVLVPADEPSIYTVTVLLASAV